jgi:hypothetical protein
MWPLPRNRNEHVAICIDASSIACAWITHSKKHPFILNAYKRAPLESSSQIHIIDHLSYFIRTHKLTHACASLSIASPLLYEQFVRLSKATATVNDFDLQSLKKMMWDYRYLHMLDDGDHLFYVCGISRPKLFAQQLLAYKTGLHLLRVTSNYTAMIQAYRALNGAAFRKSQLALDMIQSNYRIYERISNDSICRLLHISGSLTLDFINEKIPLLTLIGLCYQERER